MSIEFKLPEISEGVESADVAELRVAEGDVIEAGTVVMEVETEKAVTDIECPHAGTVTKIHVSPGDTIAIGGVLLSIDTESAGASPAASAPSEPKVTQAAPTEVATPAPAAPAPPPIAAPTPAAVTTTTAAPESTSSKGPAPAAPSTRRLARQLGVDLHLVTGNGSGGRISIEDVKAYVRTLTSGAAPQAGPVSAPPLPDFSQFGPIDREPLNKIAKASATNLSLCWQVIPHVTQHDLADITDLEAARKRFVQSKQGQAGPKVTMTAIVIKAAAVALQAFPKFNSSLDSASNELILKKYYHIGCAVDTPNGLLVPVVRDADQKTIVQIAEELTDLAVRARDRKLSMDEMQGATFTISNLGGIGGTGFTPIVNYPEVAILGLSRGKKELQLVDGQPVERLMMPLSMSYDHRVINGADAARFVRFLAQSLSDAFELMIHA